MDARLHALKLFLDFWFSPWGAAKAAQWEFLSNDSLYNDYNAAALCHRILHEEEFAAHVTQELSNASQ